MKMIAILGSAALLALSTATMSTATWAEQAAPASGEKDAPHHGRMMAKPMTRAEADTHARAMFTRLDANKDGKLDKSDRAVRRGATRLDKFNSLDKDRNGSISRDEFMADGEARGHGAPGMAKSSARDHDSGGERMMRMEGGMRGMVGAVADSDKDGSVSEAEFLAAHAKHFEMVDANHDGAISPEERRAAMARMGGHMKHRRGHAGASGQPADEGHDHPAGV